MKPAGRRAPVEEPAIEQPDEHAEAKPDADNCSLASEWECPVCYQMYCEPVLAGCELHTFCRNCLQRSQRCGSSPKCPICRCESQVDAADLPEVATLVEKLKKRDPSYESRAAASRKERELRLQREMRLQTRSVRVLTEQDFLHSREFEVCGAGSESVNGSYVAGFLPTYVGPTVYRKPNTYLFIYRWHQTQWVIAELRGPYSMGNEHEWLYCAPARPRDDFPPASGWEVQARGRAQAPAPTVCPLRAAASPAGQGTVQRRHSLPRNVDSSGAAADHTAETWATSPQDDAQAGSLGRGRIEAQAQCRCAPTCSVM